MRRSRNIVLWLIALTLLLANVVPADDAPAPPLGPFGYSLVRTADDEPADIDFFFSNESCAVCHERQFKELQGSMHSAAHTDPLYRRLAETARTEAGDKIYAFCSGCHSAAGVVTKLIPNTADADLPAEAKAGVTCDVCHQISGMTGQSGPWREPGNASFVIEQGRVKFGHSGQVAENRLHTGEKRDFFSKSEFCASCHTVIHPVGGLRIEHTYGEWKSSVYAEKGIQCQDCHMRSVEDAVKVARTLRPVVVRGQSAVEGPTRRIFPHFFVGGNANADRLANGKMHAKMAEARLKSAARIELKTPDRAAAGGELAVDVLVYNVAAGHNLPTGVTELRQMWVDLRILDANGRVLLHSGELDADGEIGAGAIRFGAVAGDDAGKPTHKLWEMKRFLWNRTIPPKKFARDTVKAKLPAGVAGPIAVEAKLRYRSVSPQTAKAIMKEEALVPKIIEMDAARATVEIR